MTDHPYTKAPSHNMWSRSVGRLAPADVDPVVDFGLHISPETKVGTAGSCFAQHIARHLRTAGYNYFVTEPGHPMLPDEIRTSNTYGLFSARYGNIYTVRQLLQLFKRAYGTFSPSEDVWKVAEDVYLDPFRPTVQPGGFISEIEMRLDRRQHLAAVRRLFEQLDIFVFTLGLTECWTAQRDGAVFPICPGVSGGEFDPLRHLFYNQSVDDVVSDFSEFLVLLARVNPKAQVILTVSPVPLAATARVDQHVLTATTYSKAVLRVACDVLTSRFAHVRYFPSYEIITGNFSRGAYYAENLRDVLEPGVSHVMRLFMQHATAGEPAADAKLDTPLPHIQPSPQSTVELAQHLIEVECDEAALDRN
jgi:hypothetical protein